jgi:drug/metabolite transporter (DMT)-like permease
MLSQGYLYAIGAAITWGLVYTIDQRVLRGASPFAYLFIDSVITAIVLLPIIFIEKHSLATLAGTSLRVWVFIFIAVVLAALANFFIFSSIKILGAETASTFEIAYPFFVIIFSYFAFKTVPTIHFLIGAVLIFVGSAIIVLMG